ncbi:MAG: DsbA family protein [Bacteroidales bacterium]|jgi:protein-disulfide isomerase|nr:DsbA family protein [Bacteroidales bacterium]
MKKHTILVYSMLAIITGLLIWILVKLHSFDNRVNKIGFMLTEQTMLNVPKQVREVSIDDGNSFSMGDSSVPVTAILFFDYECDFCKLFFVNTFPQIEEQLINTGKLRFVFRHFPIEMHPNAYIAAEMSEQARQQGKFLEMHNELVRTDNLSKENLIRIANELNVDTTNWRSNSQSVEKINTDKSVGESIFVRGTPTFIINGKMYTGMRTFEEFKEISEMDKLDNI